MTRSEILNDANPAPPISTNFRGGKKINQTWDISTKSQNWTTILFRYINFNL